MKRRTVGLTLLLALVLTGGMGSWLWSEARISTLGEVETRVGPWMPVWTAARWGLLGLTALMILGQAYRPPPSGLVPTGPGRQALGWRPRSLAGHHRADRGSGHARPMDRFPGERLNGAWQTI